MKYVNATALKTSPRPLDASDIVAAVGALFGTTAAPAGLTSEQVAEQERKLRPYMVGTPEYYERTGLRR